MIEEVLNTHPPEADKVILVDFDGTLYPWGYLFNAPEPINGAVEFMQELKRREYRIGIFTSRLSRVWLRAAREQWIQHYWYIESVLKRDNIPYDFITAEKVPCEAYFDDKAYRVDNNWKELYEQFFKSPSSL